MDFYKETGGNHGAEPMFNVPKPVLWLIAAFILIHMVRQFGTMQIYQWMIVNLGMWPLAFTDLTQAPPFTIFTLITHAFLHSDWMHLGVNSLWMLAFGTILARRWGVWRFYLFSGVAAIAGALTFMALNWGSYTVLLGASGAISGQMGGTVRLMFSVPGGMRYLQTTDSSTIPALPLAKILTNRGAMTFIAVWIGLNFVFAFSGFGTDGNTGAIAWEAHLGGFICGLFLFGLFDRRRYA